MNYPASEKQSRSVILQRQFGDIDELGEVISSRRSVQLIQLGNQPFQANLTLAEFDTVQFLVVDSACPCQAVGGRTKGFLDFACMLQPNQNQLISHKIPTDQNTLFGFDPNRGADLVLPANMQLAIVQIKQSVFEDYLQLMDRPDIDQRFLANHCVSLPTQMAAIQGYLQQLLHVIQHGPTFFKQQHLQRLILEDFLPLLVLSLPVRQKERPRSPKPLRRAELVDQAEAYMMANLDQPLTLKDLCIVLSTSSRALNYGFQDVFGLSPMAYLKQLRLHSARRVLLTATPATTSVWKVMAQFGFWSRGHFANDYKALFGESPSTTLSKTCRQ